MTLTIDDEQLPPPSELAVPSPECCRHQPPRYASTGAATYLRAN